MALASVALLLPACPSRAVVAGFNPSPGYTADDLGISADTFAVAPDGRFAVAQGSTITIYNHADPAGRAPVGAVSNTGFKTLSSLAFVGQDSLLVADASFLAGALYSATISTGNVSTIAAPGSALNVAQVRVNPRDGAAYAVFANNPGQGAVMHVTDAGLTPFASGLGTGYLGGLAFDSAGDIFVGDTNDPKLLHNAGQILELNGVGALVGSESLAGGGGYGVYDVAGSNGDFYATTGSTLTRLTGGTATEVGDFTGAYPFPTDVAADGGGILVNNPYGGNFGVFRVRPAASSVPEPSSLAFLLMGTLSLLHRRKR